MFGFSRVTLRIRRFPREWCYACSCDHAVDRRISAAMKLDREKHLLGLGDNRPLRLRWGPQHGAA